MMPFKYTSNMSLEDAEQQAETLNVKYDVVPIEPMFDAFMKQLDPFFEGHRQIRPKRIYSHVVVVFCSWRCRINPAR